ncbi:neurohypophysial n-terminal domain protein, partial [Ichthyophthirius multifiliis]
MCYECTQYKFIQYYLQYYLDGVQYGKCLKQCYIGYFKVFLDGKFICKKCENGCFECEKQDNSNFSCFSCIFGFFLYNQQCLDKCPDGFFANENSLKCESCEFPCILCEKEKNRCNSCVQLDEKGEELVLFKNKCIYKSSCPPFFFIDSINRQCLICEGNCIQCQDKSTSCTQCKNGLFAYNLQCINECPLGFFNDLNQGKCSQCSEICVSCKNNPFECFQCKNGFFFYQNKCLKECPDSFFGKNLICEKCADNCLKCTGDKPNECTGCITGFFLKDNQCVIKDICINDCHISCKECFGPRDNQCFQCNKKYYFYNQKCKECPLGCDE